MERQAEVAVIGGGVVGLAVAASLARAGRSIWLLERHAEFGREISARNSEVIHAGLYYPPGSWKARLCVAGREALYERCARLGLPHRRTGKLVVASHDDEIRALEALADNARANGVPGLRLLDAAEVARREPSLRARAALASPETGIIDSHALCLSLAAEAEAHGAELVRHSEVFAIEAGGTGYTLVARSPEREVARLKCAAVVNAAGLAGDAIAALAGFDVDALGYRIRRCKGDYFALLADAPLRVDTLVYPLPSEAGLGIHATLDLAGRLRFGPDAHYVDEVDTRVDAAKIPAVADAVRRYLPTLRDEWLAPDSSGIRPKLAGPGEGFRDFVVAEESDAGRPGFVNLLGIESPGLTAALAIGERVRTLLRGI